MKYAVDTKIRHTLNVGDAEIENTETIGDMLDVDADELADMSDAEIETGLREAVIEWSVRFCDTSWSALDEKGKPVSRS